MQNADWNGEKFIAFLTDILIKNTKCDACHAEKWTVLSPWSMGESLKTQCFAIGSYTGTDTASFDLAMTGLPMVLTICDNCGYTRSFQTSIVQKRFERYIESEGKDNG